MVNTFLKKNPFKPSTLGLTLRSAKLIGLHNVETSPHSQDAGSVSRKDLILFFGGGSQLPNDLPRGRFRIPVRGGGQVSHHKVCQKKNPSFKAGRNHGKHNHPVHPGPIFLLHRLFFTRKWWNKQCLQGLMARNAKKQPALRLLVKATSLLWNSLRKKHTRNWRTSR